jgi:hypothetical protein
MAVESKLATLFVEIATKGMDSTMGMLGRVKQAIAAPAGETIPP